MHAFRRLSLLVACLATTLAVPLSAQTTTPPEHKQVVSANPFGILLGLFNAEYERKVLDSATAGIGGSFFQEDGDDYFNSDVFFRYYPSGRPLQGFSFGIKGGPTSVEGDTYFGLGFDANWSWLLGKNDKFYLGMGFGLKRLFGAGDTDYATFIPTVRLVNIGIAF